jgi:carboxypeptidase family protein/TonB-dependent receptor-like protein
VIRDGRRRVARRRASGFVAVLFLLALPASRPALAQSTTGSLTGRVLGADTTPLPGATVEARSEETGVVRGAVTDAAGRYRFDLLAPGAWTLRAHVGDGPPGTAVSVVVTLQSTATADLVVGGAVTESVTVTAATPLVDRERTGGELSIDRSIVDDIPIAGREVTDLALLDSSVRQAPPADLFGERGTVFVINGQSGRGNSFLVDGLDNNDLTSNTTLNAAFSPLVIREFKVLTHQFAPEFGRAAGGVLNIITRQGTNKKELDFFAQGVLPGLSSEGDFVASLPDTGADNDVTGRFQAGVGVGGPIRADKAFWFLAYEHQQADDVVTWTGVGRDGVAGGFLQAPRDDDNVFLRGDFNLSSGNTLMLRLSADDRTTDMLRVGGRNTPESGFALGEKDTQFVATLTSVLTPAVLNEARLLVGSSGFDQDANSSRPGVDRPSGAFGGNNLYSQKRDEDRVQLVDNVTWQKGPHSLKFGADVIRSRTHIDTAFNPNGSFSYNTDLPFTTGDCVDLSPNQGNLDDPYAPIPCSGDGNGNGIPNEPAILGTYPVVYQLIDGQPSAVVNDTRLGLFAQDTWALGSRWVLTYGLRYDLSTYRLPDSAVVPSTIPNGGADTDRNNIAPRAAFTWSPDTAGRWLVRGGAGMFYDKIVFGFPAVAAITSGTAIGLIFPQGLRLEINENVVEQYGIDQIKDILQSIPSVTLRFSTGTTLDTPYTVLYNAGLERAVGAHGAVSADVIRALGYHQVLTRDLNPAVGTDAQGFPVHRDPTTGSIGAFVTEGRSWYSGLDLGWRWRGERNWYSASYTLSKALDLGPDPLQGGFYLPVETEDLSNEKGRADADRRHRLVLSGGFRLPWGGLVASGVAQYASGAPFNVTSGADDNSDGFTTDRPVGVRRNTGADTPLEAVNALRAQAGLAPVTHLSEPALVQVDLKVSRPFPLGRGQGEVYLQVYNLFNRVNGGPIDGVATSHTFGEPVGLVGPPQTLEGGFRVSF